MSVKKPSAKESKGRKTVSGRAAPKPSAKAAVRPAGKSAARPAPRTTAKPKPDVKAAPSRPASKTSQPTSARVAAAPAKRAPSRVALPAAPPAAPMERPEAGGNLLAGPRNVQPYIARRGEEYMSKEQLEHFRTILSSWKQDLMQEVDRTMLHMKDEAANFPDPNDRATQESEFSLELRTRDRERKLIRKIEEALKRIEDGSYGYCLETGEPIGVKRLEARPVATLSVEAQERRERREKQFGDRDDFYR
jgi:DnaK suppressor protein